MLQRQRIRSLALSALYAATFVCPGGLIASEILDRKDALYEAATETREALNSVLLGAAFAGQRMVVVGERGHILYSDDGNTWHQSVVPTRTTLTSVFFLSPQLGWAVGHDTLILKTTDGGVTWSKSLDGVAANALVLRSAQERLAQLEQRSAAVPEEETSNLASALEFAELALEEAERDMEIGPSKSLMDIWFKDENVGLVIGASGYILRTLDGGETWIDWSGAINSLDFFHLYKLFSNESGVLFLVGEVGQVYRSTDSGDSWSTLEVPYFGSFFGGLAKDSDNSVYIFGMSGVVLKSENEGESWESVNSSTKAILQNAAVISNNRVVLVGLGGTLLVEDASTLTFTLVDLGVRSALTAVLGGADNTLLLVGESGIRILDMSGDQQDWTSQAGDSLRFMFSRRNANKLTDPNKVDEP
jgi:photosystem II stability/assembly factor-like uncharacterized protein